MQHSETLTSIFPAFIAAQAELHAVIKNARNDYHESDYADLEAVIEAIKAVAHKHELGYSQLYETSEDKELNMTTIIMHKSGEWFGSTMTIPASIMDKETGIEYTSAQMYGASGTLARRYALRAAFGLTEKDDDGQSLPNPEADVPAQPRKKQAPSANTQKALNEATTLKELVDIMNGLSTEEQKPVRPLFQKRLKELNSKKQPAKATPRKRAAK